MAKEKQKTVNETIVTENDVTVSEPTQTVKKPTVVAEILNGCLTLKREAIRDKHNMLMKTKEGRQLYNYSVNGSVRGRAIKADFVPRDLGGYEPLDIIFESELPVLLVVSEETQTDFSGNKTTRTTYLAQTIDEDGNVFSCDLKPQKLSDKSLVDMLLNAVK